MISDKLDLTEMERRVMLAALGCSDHREIQRLLNLTREDFLPIYTSILRKMPVPAEAAPPLDPAAPGRE